MIIFDDTQTGLSILFLSDFFFLKGSSNVTCLHPEVRHRAPVQQRKPIIK